VSLASAPIDPTAAVARLARIVAGSYVNAGAIVGGRVFWGKRGR